MFSSDLLLPASPQQENVVPLPPPSNGDEVSCTFLLPVMCHLCVLLELRFGSALGIAVATPKTELSLGIWW